MYFYNQTLSAFPHDCLRTLEPGTRSRIYARFMAPEHETPRTRRGVLLDVCAAPLRLEVSPETRGVPSSRAGPSQNGTCSGGGIGRKSRAGRSTTRYTLFSVREDQSLHIRVSLHRVEELVLSGQNRRKQSSWFSYLLLIARSCMHACMTYMCVLALTEDLEAGALKSSDQTKAPGNTPLANARPTQDGRRGLQR